MTSPPLPPPVRPVPPSPSHSSRPPVGRAAAEGRGAVYPRRSLVLVAGVPGAGKSTLLRRLFGLRGDEAGTVVAEGGVRVIDSLQSRHRLKPVLGRIPYPLWRWVVHVLHLLRVAAALRVGDPVVVHESGTRRPVRVLLALLCRLQRYEVHVLMIDASPEEARRGQYARGRRVTERSHRTHSRRWRRLRAAARSGPEAFVPGARSLLAIDRRRARELAWMRFTPGAPAGGGEHRPAPPRGGPARAADLTPAQPSPGAGTLRGADTMSE
ncbi:AAA family ATPase [Nocardiopsis potens]|uniref:AAA family ATPase n=1 Tax=Nocardiopsis potens TaxID=1246458 RepID=UPI0009DA4882|nr:AAA family ATPase [Nocardiopsis potens]